MTQARDVFDLAILIQGGHLAVAVQQDALARAPLSGAIECLSALSWDDYAGQVVEFLGTTCRDEFGTEAAWDAMQTRVYDSLQEHA